MKTIAHILGPYRSKVSHRIFEELLQNCVDQKPAEVFQCAFSLDDQRLKNILHTLQRAGFKQWEDHSRPPDKESEYSFSLQRIYDASDLAECSLMELFIPHQQWIKDAWRDGQGRIELRGPLKKSIDFGKCIFNWYVVPERVKRLLEENEFQHVIFHETIPMTKSAGERLQLPNWSYFGKPWWELGSDFTMPPLSPSMRFFDRQGKPVKQGDYSNGFHPKEGLYNHAELHYRASDLKGLEAFDLARTTEPFSNRQGYDPFDRPLIVSKRFYDFCVEHNLKADWVPVRVDEDC